MDGLFSLLLPFSRRIAERLNLVERLCTGRWHLSRTMISLYGEDEQLRRSKRFAADTVSATIAAMIAALSAGAAAGGDPAVIVLGFLFAGLVPFAMLSRLEQRLISRKRRLAYELPELLTRLTLLVHAGETVQSALIRCADTSKAAGEDRPLAAELIKLANRLRNNESFAASLERFNKSCAIAEISVFTSTILMNYKRGGDTLVLSLRALNRELWEKRKTMTRTIGEEASSKLVFPLLLIFIAVMAIVAAPAVFLMQG